MGWKSCGKIKDNFEVHVGIYMIDIIKRNFLWWLNYNLSKTACAKYLAYTIYLIN